MADYDKAEVTDRERKAAQRQNDIAGFNAGAVYNQLKSQLENYDFANSQNRRLADVQRQQNSRKTESDRFEAQRDLQNAAMNLFGSMNQAMNGSTIGNTMRMLEDRNDKENNTFWAQHQVNQDQVENSYNDSFNQNNVSKRDAITSANKALSDLQTDLSTNLNNINPSLYEKPGSNSAINDVQKKVDQAASDIEMNNAQLSGYLMPENAEQVIRPKRNKLIGNDYYSRLINSFNGR